VAADRRIDVAAQTNIVAQLAKGIGTVVAAKSSSRIVAGGITLARVYPRKRGGAKVYLAAPLVKPAPAKLRKGLVPTSEGQRLAVSDDLTQARELLAFAKTQALKPQERGAEKTA
jgi:hypothetical protein